MRYVFFGSPKFAEIILKTLIDAGMPPSALVCNPDRPFGRKKILTAPPTKVAALSHGIPILQPEVLDADIARQIARFNPDFFVVAAYAKILPRAILALSRLGTIGVHPSLLPKYRGATPIQSAILAGESETGTTLFLIDERVDHGPVLAYSKLRIAHGDTYELLMQTLAEKSGDLLKEALPRFFAKKMIPQPQSESAATYTKKFSTDDGFVDLGVDAPETAWRKIRALNPDPGVYTYTEINGKRIRVKLLAAEMRDGKLVPTLIQREGGKPTRP